MAKQSVESITSCWRASRTCVKTVVLLLAVVDAPVLHAQTVFVDEAAVRGVQYMVVDGAFGGTGQFGCGIALADLDGDTDLDLVLSGNETSTLGFFENDGNGMFTDVSASTTVATLLKVSGLVAGDYDADGDLDLLVTRWLKPLILLRNDGAFQFTDVTFAAGLWAQSGAGAGAAFGDFDLDGWIDLAVTNRYGTNASTVRSKLFRNQGNGTFADVTQSAGVDNGIFPGFHVTWVDLDRDGDLDLYVANDKGTGNPRWNRLYRNNGNGTFFEDTNSGAQVSADAMGNATGDINGDGYPELYIPNIPAGNMLLVTSDQGAHFAEKALLWGVQAFGTCWGSAFFDGDNDADLDLVTVSDRFDNDFYFERPGEASFVDRTMASGLSNTFDSYCLAAGDLDRDGDIDLVIQDSLAPIRVMINRLADPTRAWLAMRVMPRGANTFGIGTQVDTFVNGTRAWRHVEAGSAFKSHSSTDLHVGIGAHEFADTVTITFPQAGVLPRTIRTLTGMPARVCWPLWSTEQLGDANHDGTWSAKELAILTARIRQPFEPADAIYDFNGDFNLDAQDHTAFRARQCDLTNDGIVGAADLTILLSGWDTASPDFHSDGVADANDLTLLLSQWNE